MKKLSHKLHISSGGGNVKCASRAFFPGESYGTHLREESLSSDV